MFNRLLGGPYGNLSLAIDPTIVESSHPVAFPVPAAPAAPGVVFPPPQNCMLVTAPLLNLSPAPRSGFPEKWRLRLDYGKSDFIFPKVPFNYSSGDPHRAVSYTDVAVFGEVEDYELISTSRVISGIAAGDGPVFILIGDVTVNHFPLQGNPAESVVSNLALAINDDAELSAQGISALADGNTLTISGTTTEQVIVIIPS